MPMHWIEVEMKTTCSVDRKIPADFRRGQLGFITRFVQRRVRLQPADTSQKERVPLGIVIPGTRSDPDIGCALNVRVRWKEQFEAGREHTNDLWTIGRVVLHGVAQNSAIATKTPLPVFVAQNRNGGETWRRRGSGCSSRGRRRLRLTF